MPANLVDDGAVLVHPTKAFVLRHIPVPDCYEGGWEGDGTVSYAGVIEAVAPDALDYVLRLQEAAATLFGPMEFDLHTARAYTANGLDFHADHADIGRELNDEGLVRMATCIHNVTEHDRVLHFQRPDWSGHTEEFTLPVPAKRILVFGGQLVTEYVHGIPPSDEAATFRSVVTRFSLWRSVEEP